MSKWLTVGMVLFWIGLIGLSFTAPTWIMFLMFAIVGLWITGVEILDD